jgi:hypothetical protein
MRERIGSPQSALNDRVEASLASMGDTRRKVVERRSSVQIGDVDGVTSLSNCIGECEDAGRAPLRMMEQQHFWSFSH